MEEVSDDEAPRPARKRKGGGTQKPVFSSDEESPRRAVDKGKGRAGWISPEPEDSVGSCMDPHTITT